MEANRDAIKNVFSRRWWRNKPVKVGTVGLRAEVSSVESSGDLRYDTLHENY